MGFFIGIWNFLVSIAPTVVHTVCELTKGASDVMKLGGGA